MHLEGDIDVAQLRNLLSSVLKFNLNPQASNLTSTFSIKGKKLSIIKSLYYGHQETWRNLAKVVGLIAGSILIGYALKARYNYQYANAVKKIATGKQMVLDIWRGVIRPAQVFDLMLPTYRIWMYLGVGGVLANILAIKNLLKIPSPSPVNMIGSADPA
jgi:hypothetical protein